ncbi:hypothetical protein KUM42_18280 [Modestobacter sp. L9-4]|uniref:hypothetical protein n=1 Tax=Modestobacter sp. L9-4 TaxID=2851567 RepID=UPI001C73EB8A|nr:hypothetical protein [Modestobacter sp. L9-4]QXG75718.1 hypothetical protein KUM42_18280 [Modestobacter sp. L9-4]
MTTPGPDWVEQARRFAAGLAAEHTAGTSLSDVLGGLLGPAPSAEGAAADHSAECRWCPLCTGLAALRGRRPDLLEALADVLTSAATTLRAQAGTQGTHPGGSDAAAPDPTASEPDATAPPETTVPHPAPVQRIDVA